MVATLMVHPRIMKIHKNLLGDTPNDFPKFRADQMSPRNIGSQIIISGCYKRIDKTNIPSLKRV